MLGQLPGKIESFCSLVLSAGAGCFLVFVCQSRRLGGNALEDIVYEAVHDGHRLARNARVGMDLNVSRKRPADIAADQDQEVPIRLAPNRAFSLNSIPIGEYYLWSIACSLVGW